MFITYQSFSLYLYMLFPGNVLQSGCQVVRDAPLGLNCIELILLFGKRNLMNLFDNSVVSIIIIIRVMTNKEGNEKKWALRFKSNVQDMEGF